MSSFDSKLPGTDSAKAFVVFVGQADWPWLRWLKPGFRHCFVILRERGQWISIDPLLNHMEVQVHDVPDDFDMAGWLQDRGHKVVQAEVWRSNQRPAPFMLLTCVEVVKRVIGLHDRRVMTPWQLYKRLAVQP